MLWAFVLSLPYLKEREREKRRKGNYAAVVLVPRSFRKTRPQGG